MMIDCHSWHTEEDRKREGRRVFVDGKEIHKVWYVDTDAGLVKTYDLEDGRGAQMPFAPFCRSDYPPDWEIDYRDLDEPVSRTIRGKVELLPL